MLFGKKKVTILGAGPTGLLAAHAAEKRGWEVQVFSAPDLDGTPKKSELHGCQYLHQAIPELTDGQEGTYVKYLLDGDADQYRKKVYGWSWDGTVSPDEYGPERSHYAWDLRRAYNALWAYWEPRIEAVQVTPGLAVSMADNRKGVKLTSIPAPALCLEPGLHKFTSQTIYAMGTREDDAPQYDLPYLAPKNTVQCNGYDAPRWYRAATVFGQSTLEWPGGARPPISGVATVQKPLSTDCTCHPDMVRLGRYGQWTKGVLVHEAYDLVMAL
jgi:hypothetical protein